MHATLPTLHILTSPGRESILARTLHNLRASDWPTEPVIHKCVGGADTDLHIRMAAAWREMLEEALGSSAFAAGSQPTPSAISAARAALAATAPWRASSDETREAMEVAHPAHSTQPEANGAGRDSGRTGLRTDTAPAPFASFHAAQSNSMIVVADDIVFHPHIAARLAEWPPFSRGCIRTFASLHHAGGARDLVGNRGPTWYAAASKTWRGSEALLITPGFAAYCLARWSRFPGIAPDRRLGALAARDYPTAPVWVHVPSLVEKAEDSAAIHEDRSRDSGISVAS